MVTRRECSVESFAGADGNAAPTTLAATHAALLRLAAAHGTVSLHVDVWDYQDDRPTRRRITWGASVFAPDGPGQPRLIASEHAAESPAAMLGAIAAQLEAHADAQSADVQALGEMPEVQS